MSGLRLGVNIDHVATLRQARYATMPESKNAEPDPLVAARMCERAGAGGIVAHLRADRRHIQDRDIERQRRREALEVSAGRLALDIERVWKPWRSSFPKAAQFAPSLSTGLPAVWKRCSIRVILTQRTPPWCAILIRSMAVLFTTKWSLTP